MDCLLKTDSVTGIIYQVFTVKVVYPLRRWPVDTCEADYVLITNSQCPAATCHFHFSPNSQAYFM